MRLVYFAHFAGGSDAASAMDSDLFASLRAQGHAVDVLSPYRDPNVGRIGGDIGGGRLARLALAVPGYARMIRDGLRATRSIDVRIASQYHVFHPATASAFLVARLRQRLLLVRAHDPLPGSYRNPAQGTLFRNGFRLYRQILAHPATRVAVPTEELRARAASDLRLPAERTLVIPNNVTPLPPAPPEAIQALREELGVSRTRVVLQFGSFTGAGTRTLVDAIARLSRADVRAVVLSDPWRSGTFANEALRAGVSDRFVLPGAQPYGRLAAFLGLADVVVGLLDADPLAHGSLPRNTLEAMAAGKPVVLARGAVSPSLAEDGVTCRLVPPEDADALAGAIAEILDDAELAARLGTGGRARVADRFHSDAVARAFAAALGGIP